MQALLWKIALAVGLGFLLTTVARAADGFEDAFSRARAENSTIKIEIRFVGEDGNPTDSRPLPGHGTFISDRGYVLTAAHVLFPSTTKFTESAAASYNLVLWTWDRETGVFREAAEILGSELDARTARDSALNLVQCPNTDARLLCRSANDSVSRDFAVLRTTNPEGNLGFAVPGFLDVLGPDDPIDPLRTNALAQFTVLSDFRGEGTLLPVPAIPALGLGNKRQFFTNAVQEFKEGISGSPLLVSMPAPRRSVVIAGIVVTADKKEPRSEMQVALAEDVFGSTKRGASYYARAKGWLRDERLWDCDQHYAAFPGPLVGNFFSDAVSDRSRRATPDVRRFIRCVEEIAGWQGTALLLRTIPDVLATAKRPGAPEDAIERSVAATIQAAAAAATPAEVRAGTLDEEVQAARSDAKERALRAIEREARDAGGIERNSVERAIGRVETSIDKAPRL